MEKIVFEKIHDAVLDFLNEKENSDLETIGLWYFNFLNSDEDNLKLHLPYYSKAFSKITFHYIRPFTIIYNLLKNQRLSDFKDKCLFDIFNYSKNKRAEELTLDFKVQKDNLALWQKDTLTRLDIFLPVFRKEEINDNNKEDIKNTFKLFKSIRSSNIIDFPTYIDLHQNILSFNNVDKLDDSLISENLFPLNHKLSRKEAIEVIKELHRSFINSISIKYPYSLKPTFPLTELGAKKFNLIFNNRFAYNNEILENDLILLKDESNLNLNLRFKIINTNHSKNLYDLFKLFKEEWRQLELNTFITPFPKYWFLFLNPSLTKEQWLIQFKKDFPAVAEKPIIRTVEHLIEEVIKLNWIENLITNSTKILFPELKSNRKKRLEFVFNSFKNYIHSLNPNVKFINSLDFSDLDHIVILDSFNVIDLINYTQNSHNKKIQVVVPDFLYFGYQPWIKYHLFNYQYTPLLSNMRKILDENYETNNENFEKVKSEIITEIKFDLKNYKNKYIEIKEVEELEDLNQDSGNIEDLEFTNDEEIEIYSSDIDEKNKLIIINDNLTIYSNEEILLKRDSLIYVKARALKIGDYILGNSDVSEFYKSDDIYDKLINYPNEVLYYQNRLFNEKDAYKRLMSKGLSIDTEYHFKKRYLIKEPVRNPSIIPKKKKDWAIICEFLNISDSDKQLSFIAYYGRSKQNELKQMYKTFIELLIENNWLGTIENPLILESVSEIVKQHNTIFNVSASSEITEIAESIISNIFNQLEFTEIKTLIHE